MMRNVLSLLIVCLLWTPAFPQEPDAPKTLVGFLKPGTNIGVISFENSDRITVDIYTDEDFAIAIDKHSLSLEELMAKYEKVAKEIERTRKEKTASFQKSMAKQPVPEGRELGEPIIQIPLNNRENFYKIVSVGDDYILVTRASAPHNRRVFATRFISSINWRTELPLSASVQWVEKKKTETPR